MTTGATPWTEQTLRPQRLEHPRLGEVFSWPVGNRVGESPIWDGSQEALWWIDVRAPALLRLDPATGCLRRWALPEVVGAMTLMNSGQVLLALQSGLAAMDTTTGHLRQLTPVQERSGNRLNDGKASPSGRWFVFGSMDDAATDKQPTGALYVAGQDLAVRQIHAPLVVANGIAFSPDGRWLYFSDSALGIVQRGAWHDDTGEMAPPVPICRLDATMGRPDGAAVDGLGRYWSAGVSAGVLHCLSPEGALIDSFELPCRAPTMPAFGGPRSNLMFVTSLVRQEWLYRGPHDGNLLSFQTPLGAVSPVASSRFTPAVVRVVH